MRHSPQCGCPYLVRALITHCVRDLSLAELAQLRVHVDDEIMRKVRLTAEETVPETPRAKAQSRPDPDDTDPAA